MFGFLKKFITKTEAPAGKAEKMAIGLRQKSAEFTRFLGDKAQEVHNEFLTIKNKCQNLRETNYNLGLKHLENGHLSDAIFRFRFTKKFWPDLYDTYYQLAYCLVLDNKLPQAKETLEELLIKKPDYDAKARELLDHINSALQNPTTDA